MPAGSALVFAGSLIHRGGANSSDGLRLAITPQYCMPWLRQIENMVLACRLQPPPSTASGCRVYLVTALSSPGLWVMSTGGIRGR